MYVTCLLHMCDMTHWCVYHDSFKYANMRRDSFTCVPWLMIRSYECHDPFLYVTCLHHMRDMTRWYVYHDSFKYAPWLIHMCARTHEWGKSNIWHHTRVMLSVQMTWLIHILHYTRRCVYIYIFQHKFLYTNIHINDMTHSYVTSYTWLIHMWHYTRDMPRIHMTRLIHMWHVTCFVYKWHDSFICDIINVTCLLYI